MFLLTAGGDVLVKSFLALLLLFSSMAPDAQCTQAPDSDLEIRCVVMSQVDPTMPAMLVFTQGSADSLDGLAHLEVFPLVWDGDWNEEAQSLVDAIQPSWAVDAFGVEALAGVGGK